MRYLPGKIFLLFFSLAIICIVSTLNAPKIHAADPSRSRTDMFFDVRPTVIFKEEQDAREQENKTNEGQPQGSYSYTIYDVPEKYRDVQLTFNTFNDMLIGTVGLASAPSALGFVSGLMADMYTHPPASGLAYVHDLLGNAGFVAKPVYAQGIGFAGLVPMLPIWTTMRNIAYTIIVIVMVVIGFMIIFRMKIDPKTVITIQMAIPKIIIALILVTFSYAIVGFLIDIMYLVIALVIDIFYRSSIPPQTALIGQAQQSLMTGSVFTLMKYVFGGGWDSLMTLAQSLWKIGSGAGVLAGVFALILGAGWWASLVAGVPSLLFAFAIGLGLLFTFVRLWFLLFNAYIQLLIALLLGPIQLLMEAIPGKSTFGGWVKNIVANLSVFPTTIALILLGTYLASSSGKNSMWMPPLMGFSSGSMQDSNTFTGMVGLGLIFVSPTLVGTVKKMIGAKSAIPVSTTTVFAPLMGGFQTGIGAATSFSYLSQSMTGIKNIFGSKQPGGSGHGG